MDGLFDFRFIWSDGGRAACGYVGLAGDCVVRSISIASGRNYRDVYKELGDASLKSPRNGVPLDVVAKYMLNHGWQLQDLAGMQFTPNMLPKGAVVVSLFKSENRCRHLTCLVDQTVYDTWNPAEDGDYRVDYLWVPPVSSPLPAMIYKGGETDARAKLNQEEFEKILRRLRALDKTAQNAASTEGERRNALRMMQSLMLENHLTRDDIEGREQTSDRAFTRLSCAVNGQRICTWEIALARYIVHEFFPLVQFYRDKVRDRSIFWFYGPRQDVSNALALFKELLLTIAASAYLRYRSYARGSGASYAEGYVAGLPRQVPGSAGSAGNAKQADSVDASQRELMLGQAATNNRMMVVHDQARKWLGMECGVRLASVTRSGRQQHDGVAASHGQRDGASHVMEVPGRIKRIAFGK